MSSPPPSPPPNEQETPKGSPYVPALWILVILLGLAGLIGVLQLFSPTGAIPYSRFQELAQDAELNEVTFLGKEKLRGVLRDPDAERFKELELDDGEFVVMLPASEDQFPIIAEIQQGYQERFDRLRKEKPDETIEKLREELPEVKISREEEPGAWVGPVLMGVLMLLLLAGLAFMIFFPRGRDPGAGSFFNNYVKSPAKRYERAKAPRVTFDDVAGMEGAKAELREVVEFLMSPEKFERLGARIPKGVLLVGPPGTGKTLLARAVAGEAGVPFFSVSGSEFIQMFVGVGASRVRDLFKTAKENSPCLMFIDEIDAVGRMRGAGVGGGSDEREQTLNQILSEMDGFQPSETVIVIAATNRPDVLDSALLRPGRFDRHVTVDRANWQGRLAILKVHTRNKPLDDDLDLELIARKMIGMTGADLANLANEAALLAAREGKLRIGRTDFENAADRVLIGPKREEVLSPDEKRRTAYHEAGHALVCWLQPAADKPLKVSIVPRGQALGVNIIIPEEERHHYGQAYFHAKLVMAMGGRAADRLVYGEANAGAQSDLKQATRLARQMVTHWGMSERVGPMMLRIGEEHVFLGKEIQEARDFSEGLAEIVDEEVQRLLREADQHAYELLSNHRELLDRIAEALLKQEELERGDIDKIVGSAAAPRPENGDGRLNVGKPSSDRVGW